MQNGGTSVSNVPKIFACSVEKESTMDLYAEVGDGIDLIQWLSAVSIM